MVVVGGGVMGSATAVALGRRGVDTVLLEQFELGHPQGSSHGPTRIFRLAYPHADYTRLALRALEAWRRLEDDAAERLLVQTGGLDVGSAAEECRRSLDANHVPYEWLSPPEAGDRFPSIDFSGLDQILYQPDAAVCLADRTVAAQARVARATGVDVRQSTPVRGITATSDGVSVATDGGEVGADAVVVTAGAWAGPLLRSAGLDLPLTPILQHITYFAPRDPAAGSLPTFIDWSDQGLAWYALPPAGEAPGMKVGQHVGGRPIDPDDGPFEVDPARPTAHAEYVRRRLPGLQPEPVHAETCLYTMTPDDDFVLDRVGNVVVGSPCSGHGFKFAPLLGEVLADLAVGGSADLPEGRFSLARRALQHV